MARRRALQRPSNAPAPRPAVKTAPPSLKTSLLFLALALYLGSTAFKLCMQEWNLYQEGRVLQAEKDEQLTRHQTLSAEIARSKTNAGLEKLAREQLGLVMAEEIPVKTIAPATPAPQLAAAPRHDTHTVGLPPAMGTLARFITAPWQ